MVVVPWVTRGWPRKLYGVQVTVAGQLPPFSGIGQGLGCALMSADGGSTVHVPPDGLTSLLEALQVNVAEPVLPLVVLVTDCDPLLDRVPTDPEQVFPPAVQLTVRPEQVVGGGGCGVPDKLILIAHH